TSGIYTVQGLPGGNYIVRASPNPAMQNYITQFYGGVPFDGLWNTGVPVDVTINATRTPVNFTLSSGGSLSGTVTGAAAAPIGGTQIGVYSSSGRLMKTALTDAFGKYTVTGLAAGNYYVSTSAPSIETPYYLDELYNDVRPCLNCVTASGATP